MHEDCLSASVLLRGRTPPRPSIESDVESEVYTYIHICMYFYVYMYIRIFVYICMNMYIHMCFMGFLRRHAHACASMDAPMNIE